MKKLLIGLSLLGLTNLLYPHNANEVIVELLLEENYITPRNSAYFLIAQENSPSGLVKSLQNSAAEFDPKKYEWADPQATFYEITFKKGSGTIRATYDNSGNIINTSEKYDNISLPASVRNSIWRRYEGYYIMRNSYELSYSNGRKTKAIYKVWLQRNGQNKRLKLHV
ncbi:hypothetical protein [Arenibacter certesii]|uniref:Uncharacterized protein n=1 Tax=Arenibacter certesii TaxID=228955 RepID=A0A918J3Y2_9FLAO|nr:hypothetical protein [Arenibacter certesii]GGW45352.1 hypothetical protein GCM10007383_32130 [Arenibacter certesii]